MGNSGIEVTKHHRPIKNFGENGAWAYPGLPDFLRGRVKPIISGTGIATKFKSNFVCTFIWLIGTKTH